jgi:RNA polymerase sigma-B factor
MRPSGPQRLTSPSVPAHGMSLPSTCIDTPRWVIRPRPAERDRSPHPPQPCVGVGVDVDVDVDVDKLPQEGHTLQARLHTGAGQHRPSQAPTSPAEPGRPDETAVLDPRFAGYRATADRELRNSLVEDHCWLARHCVRRFKNTGEPIDDLLQVAMVGLVKAVDRFDPALGFAFTTFAVPTIMGELRRHFRDRTWALRVPRRLKDHHLILKNGADQLQHTLGRSPTIPELAAHCGLSTDEALEALEAGNAYRGVSLMSDQDDDPNNDTEHLSVDEPGYATSEARMVVPGLLAALPSDRERQIIKLRFVDNMSQSQIAAKLGLSQVHISRLLRTSLDQMRRHLTLDSRR